jgi:hypothetical protein
MMHRAGFVLLAILGLLIGFLAIVPQGLEAQDFPYAVPQAPEFDRGGRAAPADQADTETPRKRKRSHHRHEQSSPRSRSDYRTVRPYVPQDAPPAGQQPAGPRAPLGATYHGPTSAPRPPAPAPPSASVQRRPDCSQYPMMIARSRSEPEMREISKQYLTCLLMNGWNIEQARNHVIATIESTYRLAR